MSAKKWAGENWANWIASSMITFIPLLLIYWFGLKDASAEKIVEELDKKATKEYVNDRFSAHESKDEKVIEAISKDIEDLKQADRDTRKEYLKEIQLLRKDILEIWKSKNK